MTNYDIIHTITNIDVSKYNYFAILLDGTGTVKGESITTTGPIILPVAIRTASDVSGANLNSDGTWAIK
jgi:hypothetical protein